MSGLKIQYLSKKTVKSILTFLENRKDIDPIFLEIIREHEEVKIVISSRFEIIVFDSIPALFRKLDRGIYIPTLYVLNMLYSNKKIVIVPSVTTDEGAIAPLKRGADLMIPGIKKINKSFSKGDIVAIMEPGERYIVAVGIALVNSIDVAPNTKGRGIENLSHIDDEIWSTSLHIVKALSR